MINDKIQCLLASGLTSPRTDALSSNAAVRDDLQVCPNNIDVLLRLPGQLSGRREDQRLWPAANPTMNQNSAQTAKRIFRQQIPSVAAQSLQAPIGRFDNRVAAQFHHFGKTTNWLLCVGKHEKGEYKLCSSQSDAVKGGNGAYCSMDASSSCMTDTAIMDVFPVPDCACAMTSRPAAPKVFFDAPMYY